jgi:DNA-binding protein H-NS
MARGAVKWFRTRSAEIPQSERPSRTWAGRGLQPLWLRDAIKSGKKLDSFLIVKTAKKRCP